MCFLSDLLASTYLLSTRGKKWSAEINNGAGRLKTFALASKLANLRWTQRLQERRKLCCKPGLTRSLQVIAERTPFISTRGYPTGLGFTISRSRIKLPSLPPLLECKTSGQSAVGFHHGAHSHSQ